MKKNILGFSAITLFMMSACGIFTGLGFETISGSGNVITATRDVANFNRVDVCCGMVLNLTQGDQESLKIEADDNFMDEILTRVDNGTLTIQYRITSNVSYRPTKPVLLELTVVDINGVSISGGGKFNCEQITSDRFDLELSGGSDANLGALAAEQIYLDVSGGGDSIADSIQAETIDIHMSGGSETDIKDLATDTLSLENSGGGRATVAGSITKGKINLSGGSNINGKELGCKEMNFSSSGGGRSTLWVQDSLEVTLSGGSSLGYYGSPEILRENLSGGSNLDSLGEP